MLMSGPVREKYKWVLLAFLFVAFYLELGSHAVGRVCGKLPGVLRGHGGSRIVRGEIPNDPARYDHDLKVHELTLMACGYGR